VDIVGGNAETAASSGTDVGPMCCIQPCNIDVRASVGLAACVETGGSSFSKVADG
jgi:hypothetical protein